MNVHEENFVKSFIAKNRRERYMIQLDSNKMRKNFLYRLAHNLEFDERFAIKMAPAIQNAKTIERLLKEKGAKKICHIISENNEIDGKDLPIEVALNRVVGYTMGTIISCIPGILAYYESEDIGERYIFYKKKI